MLVYRTKKSLVRSARVGSDLSYFHKQTTLEKTLIRQLLVWICFVCKGVKRCLYEVKGQGVPLRICDKGVKFQLKQTNKRLAEISANDP